MIDAVLIAFLALLLLAYWAFVVYYVEKDMGVVTYHNPWILSTEEWERAFLAAKGAVWSRYYLNAFSATSAEAAYKHAAKLLREGTMGTTVVYRKRPSE